MGRILLGDRQGSEVVAGLMWCGGRVPLLIWSLNLAEVWMVIMSMEPFMETGPEKVSNEN